MKNYEELIRNIMSENGLYGEVYSDYDNPNIVYVEISWGDWKHDHARLVWCVGEQLNHVEHFSTVTEQDGSDCYSAKHTFIFKDTSPKEPLVFEVG